MEDLCEVVGWRRSGTSHLFKQGGPSLRSPADELQKRWEFFKEEMVGQRSKRGVQTLATSCQPRQLRKQTTVKAARIAESEQFVCRDEDFGTPEASRSLHLIRYLNCVRPSRVGAAVSITPIQAPAPVPASMLPAAGQPASGSRAALRNRRHD